MTAPTPRRAEGRPGGPAPGSPATAADLDRVRAQLGREPRGVVAVAHRCSCGQPDVVTTAPVLPDGTPFPTLYYLTCPRAAALVGTLEAEGVMRTMQDRLASDPGLAAAYRSAHSRYLRDRARLGSPPELDEVSAGGMPTRVKCLHALVAHGLACGPGTNPLGDEALALLPDWGADGPCTEGPA
jgi:hypothetical protein